MSQSSPILSLPYIQPSQAQKHVTHNEALQTLDLIVQLRVEAVDLTAPPPSPVEGQAFIPAVGASGPWAGHAQQIAVWRDNGWSYLSPQPGWRAWDLAAETIRVWTGTAWEVPALDTNNLSGVGIGATADATNVLAASGPASLLTHSGAGHQLKINKSGTGETASVLFQSDWAGHAELGLAGNTDFSVKVSPDGSAWTDAVVVAADTGRVGINAATPEARADIRAETGEPVIRATTPDPVFASTAFEVVVDRAANTAFDFARFTSSGQGDLAFRFAGDGNATCDGSWTGGGADYAEYFEWADGNPHNEDRRGLSVVLDGRKIRPAQAGEQPIGVISATPSVIGDGDIGHWKDKYLRDAFGAVLTEEYEVQVWEGETGQQVAEADTVPENVIVPEVAARQVMTRRVVNPDYDATAVYSSRAERPEWAIVGLMGKLRLRTGQPTDPRWQRMHQISDDVEEWLIR
ncbi:MAG: peptidase G2 autoproteolytic cleavage domain-containing protein [Paracoccaceae bacterium]